MTRRLLRADGAGLPKRTAVEEKLLGEGGLTGVGMRDDCEGPPPPDLVVQSARHCVLARLRHGSTCMAYTAGLRTVPIGILPPAAQRKSAHERKRDGRRPVHETGPCDSNAKGPGVGRGLSAIRLGSYQLGRTFVASGPLRPGPASNSTF